MQDDVVALFAYDRWANTQGPRRLPQADRRTVCRGAGPGVVVGALDHLPHHPGDRVPPATLAGDPDDSIPTEADLATVDDAARLLERAYRRFEELRPTLTPDRLNTLLTLHPPGFTATLPRWAMLRHIVNHSTYHRGQVASKLKRFGIEQPVSDFFFWVIEQIPQEA